MRLWHKDLIEVLPRQQLLGQWRECCAIAKKPEGKGNTKSYSGEPDYRVSAGSFCMVPVSCLEGNENARIFSG